MAYENILFSQKHLVVSKGYFYLLDYTQRLLSQKTSSGSTCFQYPVNMSTTFNSYTVGDVICMQYDGYSFWTLQVFSDNSGIIIRRWVIINFICELVAQFPKINSSSAKYLASTFSLEYYNTTLYSNFISGSSYIIINEYTDSVVFTGTTICLYNERYNTKEIVTVSYIDNTFIYLETPLYETFYSGDFVVITPSIFLFNNYYLTDNTKGSLIMMDTVSGTNMYIKEDVEYFGITASKFCRLQNILNNYSDVHTLAYVKGVNLKLRNMSDMYRYTAALRGNDDFTGLNYTLPNEEKWFTSGDPFVYENQLFCTVAGIGHDKLSSVYNLTGDFSVQVSGTCSGVTTYSGTDLGYKSQHYIGVFCANKNYSFGFDYTNVEFGYKDMYMHLKMDGNAMDSVGTYNGTLYNSPTLVAGYDGTANGAYSLSTSAYIKITSATTLELGKDNADFSLVFWIKLNSTYTSSFRSITHKGNVDLERTFGVWHTPNTNKLHVTLSTTSDVNFNATTINDVPLYTWFLFSYVKQGNTLSVYINNILDNTATFIGSSVSNTGPIYIGNDPWYSGAVFSIDNYTIFNRAITSEEVSFIYYKDFKFMINSSTTLPQFSTYVDDYKYYITPTVSGTDFPFNYLLKAERRLNSLNFYCNTLISGVEQGWTQASTFTLPSVDCKLILGLNAYMVTTSGNYFDNLTFNSGYLVYPIVDEPYYGIMNMDNIKKNNSTVITVYDIDIEGDNLYRLQNEATYYGNDYSWSTYNYQVSPIRNFIDFITVDAVSHILPATGRNTTTIKSITLDQYGQGVVNKLVTFSDDDSIGFITTKKVNTDMFYNTGRADTGYTSGTDLRIVTIDATVVQED